MPIDQTKGLYVRWVKSQADLTFYYPRRCDGRLANLVFCSPRQAAHPDVPGHTKFVESFVDELEKRGYDITTFKFSCLLKKEN